ncbi:hypothetical protein AYI68_g7039 [Smittium mucronatum]|uniref:Urea active transporter 1 n=1 Tax=Smittium mucronatum TaxID=133383 RepID=A0A1R0GPU9_9FUNG|nr:hypothetical protein AYI68_g7039 [Smittium mucronatum]
MEVQPLNKGLANGLIYASLGVFLIIGMLAGRHSSRDLDKFIKALYTQGTLSIGLNFVAVNIGSSLFYSLPEFGTIGGVLGVFSYAIAGVVPVLLVGIIGSLFREHNPDNWSMSSFLMDRFGIYVNTFYCIICILFMILYMVGELTTVYGAYQLLTDVDPTAPVIVMAAVTVTYSGKQVIAIAVQYLYFDVFTLLFFFNLHVLNLLSSIFLAFGGVLASLITDYIQTLFALTLIIISIVTIGIKIKIPKGAPAASDLLTPTKISYTSLYILMAALIFSTLFHQGFWQRALSSKNEKNLKNGTYIGAAIILVLFVFVGMAGPLAAWSGLWSEDSDVPGSSTFFLILATMPEWIVALTLILVTCLGCSAMDTEICSMAGSIYDLTRNKLNFLAVRVVIVALMVPVVVIAFKTPDILQIFLLADLIASAVGPPMLVGLVPQCNLVTEIDALFGGVMGILSVGIFGCIYLGNAYDGWRLLLLEGGLYTPDNRVLGAFLVAPISSLGFCFISTAIRWAIYKYLGREMPVYKRRDFSAENSSLINGDLKGEIRSGSIEA